jgi:hypothetical protein
MIQTTPFGGKFKSIEITVTSENPNPHAMSIIATLFSF